MSTTLTPYRSSVATGPDTFRQLVHAEWTKFRTVRGWVVATAAAALLTVGFGLLVAAGSHTSCMDGDVEIVCPGPPLGPDGEAVKDSFYFAHQTLDGDGTLTVRVASLDGGVVQRDRDFFPDRLDAQTPVTGSVAPWAKAGLIVKASTAQGSA